MQSSASRRRRSTSASLLSSVSIADAFSVVTVAEVPRFAELVALAANSDPRSLGDEDGGEDDELRGFTFDAVDEEEELADAASAAVSSSYKSDVKAPVCNSGAKMSRRVRSVRVGWCVTRSVFAARRCLYEALFL